MFTKDESLLWAWKSQGETELLVCEAGLRQWQSAMRTVSKTIWSRV